ncbi:MAG: hypothetical protein K0R54_5194 [Clostridiaceae bacterium]|nr:hypothetical protein [Clostridiaceae bacterium]
MKRRSFSVLLCCMIILITISFCIYQFNFILPKIMIDDLRIIDTKIDNKNLVYEYGVSENELEILKQNNIKLKCIVITCIFNNSSFFKSIDDAQLVFEDDKEKPDIILGRHPDVGFETLNIKANKTIRRGITILIDPKEYTDEQIIDMLKKVKIVMVQEVKGETRIESKPVALEIGAES